MKVTNTERMSQLASCISTNVRVIMRSLDENALNTKISRISDKTVADLLNHISQLSLTISGDTEDAKYYYADIDLPYSQDTFPVEHRGHFAATTAASLCAGGGFWVGLTDSD